MRAACLLLLFLQSAAWDEPHDRPMGKGPGVPGFQGSLPLPHDPPLGRRLTLVLETSRRAYTMGEGITVRMTAVNKTQSPVLCLCMLHTLKHREPMIEIEYRRPGQPFRAFHVTSRERCVSCPVIDGMTSLYELRPGEYVRVTSDVAKDFATGGTPFAGPGRYQLRAVLRDAEDKRPASTVVSNEIEVEVIASDAGPR